jgi:hypothetical protein
MSRGKRLGIATLGLLVALGPALAFTEPVAGPRTPQRVYEVKPGDTLTSLAKRYGVSVATLVKLNKLPSVNAQLKVGQHLVIPGSDAPATTVHRAGPTHPGGSAPTRTVAATNSQAPQACAGGADFGGDAAARLARRGRWCRPLASPGGWPADRIRRRSDARAGRRRRCRRHIRVETRYGLVVKIEHKAGFDRLCPQR